jgi:TrpR family trp operon transcriptional repressor
MTKDEVYAWELMSILQQISGNKQLLREFLIDLLTPTEYQEIMTRWQIVKQLYKGVPQRKIAKNLNVSIATITRGSRELRDKKGGFAKALKFLSKK